MFVRQDVTWALGWNDLNFASQSILTFLDGSGILRPKYYFHFSLFSAVVVRISYFHVKKVQKDPSKNKKFFLGYGYKESRIIVWFQVWWNIFKSVLEKKYLTQKNFFFWGMGYFVEYVFGIVYVRYHFGGWSEEVNSCILIISYMVYL